MDYKGEGRAQRELEIRRWMGEGKSNREISTILGISAITLKHHVSKIYRKLDVQNRADAAAQGSGPDNDRELAAHGAKRGLRNPGPGPAGSPRTGKD